MGVIVMLCRSAPTAGLKKMRNRCLGSFISLLYLFRSMLESGA